MSHQGMDPISKFYVQFQTEEYLINCVRIGEGPQPIFAFSGIMGKILVQYSPFKTPQPCSRFRLIK